VGAIFRVVLSIFSSISFCSFSLSSTCMSCIDLDHRSSVHGHPVQLPFSFHTLTQRLTKKCVLSSQPEATHEPFRASSSLLLFMTSCRALICVTLLAALVSRHERPSPHLSFVPSSRDAAILLYMARASYYESTEFERTAVRINWRPRTWSPRGSRAR
jgi:hypothetical protein